jgi:sulfate adenylyltransferase subunit 1
MATASTSFEEFLDAQLHQDLLRFTTAGSVDDGKSTLIGRLLHDTRSVYEDQLASIRNSRINRAAGPIDFSLLTDGLRAEREQGITIDVAYRYFSTSRRKFIIADTPGHEQYTRNMATGASTAELAIVLIDGTRGLLPQSRRHTYIASLLRIPHIIAAVNKMDMIGFDPSRFDQIRQEFLVLAERLNLNSVEVIPVSALDGDNVVNRSTRTPWYKGPTLLEHLEQVPVAQQEQDAAMRFPVQLVLRPDAAFRGFAGQIAGGTIQQGDHVISLASGQQTRIRSIVTFDGKLRSASAPMSVTLELEDEIDLSRGDMLVPVDEQPHASTRFAANVVWMQTEPLHAGKTYLIKHTTRTLRVTATRILSRIDVNTAEHVPAEQLQMNDIADVEFQAARSLHFDLYAENRFTGSFILIDPITNATVGAGMIHTALKDNAATHGYESGPQLILCRPQVAQPLEQALRDRGYLVVLLDDPFIPVQSLSAAIRAAQLAGALAISSRAAEHPQVREAISTFIAPHALLDTQELDLPSDHAAAVQALLPLVRTRIGTVQ